jgi:putrescine aminotransferase
MPFETANPTLGQEPELAGEGILGRKGPARHPSTVDVEATLHDYHEYVNQRYAKVTISADYKVFEESAQGVFVYDNEGRKYLDCLASYGVMNFGHRHPKIVQAVSDQLTRMPLTTKELLNPSAARLGKMLAERLPGDLKYTFFCNSGTEASEGAMKIARWHTGKPGIISTINSFHGKTLGSISVTWREAFREPIAPLLPQVQFVPFGDAQAIADAINDQTGCVILEPVQGEGGVNVPPPGYLKAVQEICRAKGVVFILDECQTGMGRLGEVFGCVAHGCEPDIVTGGKAFGGGVVPAGFITGTSAIWTKLNEFPTFHTSTFGGGQLACAAAMASLELIDELDLCRAARERGAQFKAGFQALKEEFPHILHDVRGQGLLLAVEYYDGNLAEKIYNRLFEEGILVGFLLRNPKVMRIEPPLIITEAQVQFALDTFRKLFVECSVSAH